MATTVQMRILESVRQGHTSRKAITEFTGMQKGFAAAMGAVTKGKCEKGTLVGDGLLKAAKGEGGEWEYTLTPAGRKSLDRCDKSAVKASLTVREVNRTAKPKAKAKASKGGKAKGAKAKSASKPKAKAKASKPAKGESAAE